MIREFNQQWEQDYVRKTEETLQDQTDTRRITLKKSTQRSEIDGSMGEG